MWKRLETTNLDYTTVYIVKVSNIRKVTAKHKWPGWWNQQVCGLTPTTSHTLNHFLSQLASEKLPLILIPTQNLYVQISPVAHNPYFLLINIFERFLSFELNKWIPVLTEVVTYDSVVLTVHWVLVKRLQWEPSVIRLLFCATSFQFQSGGGGADTSPHLRDGLRLSSLIGLIVRPGSGLPWSSP